jgi:hypothetical protein
MKYVSMKIEPKGRKPAMRQTKSGEAYHGRSGMGRGMGLTRTGAVFTAPKRRPAIVPPTLSGSAMSAQMSPTLRRETKEMMFVLP